MSCDMTNEVTWFVVSVAHQSTKKHAIDSRHSFCGFRKTPAKKFCDKLQTLRYIFSPSASSAVTAFARNLGLKPEGLLTGACACRRRRRRTGPSEYRCAVWCRRRWERWAQTSWRLRAVPATSRRSATTTTQRVTCGGELSRRVHRRKYLPKSPTRRRH